MKKFWVHLDGMDKPVTMYGRDPASVADACWILFGVSPAFITTNAYNL